MAIDVFLSVGRTSTDAQEQFVQAVERCLLDNDLRPRTLGRGEWSSVQPLEAIRDQMAECSGTAVVAFERTRIESGVDHQGSEEAKDLRGRGLPTVWNQIEATMAYSLGHPLLVIVEEGLRGEGLLEARYDWMVQWLPLRPEALQTEMCQGIIRDWKRRVASFHETRSAAEQEASGDTDIGDKTIAQLLGEVRPGQARALIAGVIGVIAATFSLGVTVG